MRNATTRPVRRPIDLDSPPAGVIVIRGRKPSWIR